MTLTAKEEQILNHVIRWGSDGYVAFVTKVGRQWHVIHCPTVFSTKRAATEQFERYLDTLHDRKAGLV